MNLKQPQFSVVLILLSKHTWDKILSLATRRVLNKTAISGKSVSAMWTFENLYDWLLTSSRQSKCMFFLTSAIAGHVPSSYSHSLQSSWVESIVFQEFTILRKIRSIQHFKEVIFLGKLKSTFWFHLVWSECLLPPCRLMAGSLQQRRGNNFSLEDSSPCL